MDVKTIVETYQRLCSIRATAYSCHLSEQVVRRILITEGVYSSEKSTSVADMMERGMTVEEIATALGIQPKTVIFHTPYRRGSYVVGEKSQNALTIARMRKRKNRRKN